MKSIEEIKEESLSRVKPESESDEIIEVTVKPVIYQSQKFPGLFVPSINAANQEASEMLCTSSKMSTGNDNSGELNEDSIISGLNNTENLEYEITAIQKNMIRQNP